MSPVRGPVKVFFDNIWGVLLKAFEFLPVTNKVLDLPMDAVASPGFKLGALFIEGAGGKDQPDPAFGFQVIDWYALLPPVNSRNRLHQVHMLVNKAILFSVGKRGQLFTVCSPPIVYIPKLLAFITGVDHHPLEDDPKPPQ